MKELDLRIRYTDLNLPLELDIVRVALSAIESAVVSSFKGAGSREQILEIGEVINFLHKNCDGGVIKVPDHLWAKLIGWWRNQNVPPLVGPSRVLWERLDRVMCPDDHKEGEEPGLWVPKLVT